jgi:peptide methionine sulfoxide reductase msrA/msrB
VTYDDTRISLDRILFSFFAVIDPEAVNRQGHDVGTQYQSGIYWEPGDAATAAVVLELCAVERRRVANFAVETEPCASFFPAEDYHQDYLDKNPGGYCHVSPRAIQLLSQGAVDPGRWRRPSDDTIRAALTPIQYDVTQNAATEAPFTGAYYRTDEPGIYVDVVTGEPLFSSADKYLSSCGWPAFSNAIDPGAMVTLADTSHGMVRTEVRSRAGDSHLGHVFTGDAESPNGVRFCINSASLRFVPLDRMAAEGYGDLVPLVEGE